MGGVYFPIINSEAKELKHCSMKNKFKKPLSSPVFLAVLFCAVGIFTGLMYTKITQAAYLVLSPGHQDAQSMLNSYRMLDNTLLEQNAKLEKINKGHLSHVFMKSEHDPILNQKYVELAKKVRAQSDSAVNYLNELLKNMVTDYDGKIGRNGSVEFSNPLKKLNDPNKYFSDHQGVSLGKKLVGLRADFEKLIPPEDEENYPFKGMVLDPHNFHYQNDDVSWEKFVFGGVPLQAIPVIIRRIICDIRITENNILKYLFSRLHIYNIISDFTVAANYKRPYVYYNDTYEANIYLNTTYHIDYQTSEIFVDGHPIPVENGVGIFRETAQGVGTRKFDAKVILKNPATGERTTYSNEFEYEVGTRVVSLRSESTGILYVGVDNLLSIEAVGIQASQLEIETNGAGLTLTPVEGSDGFQFIAKADEPGQASIGISGRGIKETSFDFLVKRIPDPVVYLADQKGGEMEVNRFVNQNGITSRLEDFDFEVDCTIEGFDLIRISGDKEEENASNSGSDFSAQAKKMVKEATPGDWFIFKNISARCPGDSRSRRLSDMVFRLQ